MILESGTGNGKLAGIDDDNRVLTASFNIPFPHLIAKDYQKTFSVHGSSATLSVGDNSVLLLENDNEDNIIVLNRVILQTVGVTPSASDYFLLETDSEYSTGGTAVTPVNLSSGSSVTSGAVAYEGNFGLTGAPKFAATIWPQADKALINLPIEGGVLVLPGKSVSVGYTSAAAVGFVVATVFFSVVGTDGYSG